jgi:ABC-type proline/glycine betaine transport system, ATPase component
MASAYKATAKEVMVTDSQTKIEIRNLYKIFGDNPHAMMDKSERALARIN